MKEILEETPCLNEGEIKRFLAEESSQKELRRVENHLLDCPFCTDAVEGFEGYYSFESDKSLDLLKASFEEKEAKVITIQKQEKRFTLNRIAAAVLALVLPLATWFYMSNNNAFNGDDLGTEGTLRAIENEKATEELNLTKIISLYESKQYEAALAASEATLEEDEENIKVTYFAGLSALKSEEYKSAAEYFMTLRMNSDFYYEEATWLEAQAQIGAQDMERAKLLLDGLVVKEGPYKEKGCSLEKQYEIKNLSKKQFKIAVFAFVKSS